MAEWIRTACHDSACVEVRRVGGVVRQRVSVVPEDELPMTVREWRAFVAAVKAGQFDEVGDA